ncbi:MAG: hypothetical protein IIC64_12535 [SAR324 cluster bacterium]|nr:hypothetical protein [SAR324 cluster bacterium]
MNGFQNAPGGFFWRVFRDGFEGFGIFSSAFSLLLGCAQDISPQIISAGFDPARPKKNQDHMHWLKTVFGQGGLKDIQGLKTIRSGIPEVHAGFPVIHAIQIRERPLIVDAVPEGKGISNEQGARVVAALDFPVPESIGRNARAEFGGYMRKPPVLLQRQRIL